MSESCPPFLEPRLRLFLSADIVGSTSLKQTRVRYTGEALKSDYTQGPAWFSAIQGFYFEATQAFHKAWHEKRDKSEDPEKLFGEEPQFWKSVGDEVLFTKTLTDHRQLITTLHCWKRAVSRMKAFLKRENPSLDVKCTAWLAGFPYRNREVVISSNKQEFSRQVEDYYKKSGEILNKYYSSKDNSEISLDYIGPSIDTGFRLTSYSSARKMVLSLDAAYLISMTSFDGDVERIDLIYEGSFQLKGVIGGAAYPVFWMDMSAEDSLSVKEDKLRSQKSCNKEDVKEFCDAFYTENDQFMFRPFIKGDVGQTMAKTPKWYSDYHEKLVKAFQEPSIDYSSISEDADPLPIIEDAEKENKANKEVIEDLVKRREEGPN